MVKHSIELSVLHSLVYCSQINDLLDCAHRSILRVAKAREVYALVGLTEAELVSFCFSLARTGLSELGQENGVAGPTSLLRMCKGVLYTSVYNLLQVIPGGSPKNVVIPNCYRSHYFVCVSRRGVYDPQPRRTRD